MPGTLTLQSGLSQVSLGRSLEILEDPDGDATLETVSQANFIASTDEKPNFGITSNTYWARVVLDNQSDREEWYLDQDDAQTRYIDVWLMPEGHPAVHLQGGSMRPRSARNVDSLTHSFKVVLPRHTRTVMMVRVQSDYVATFRLTLHDPESFSERQRSMNLVHGIYVGIILSLLAYNGFIYMALRERAYLNYINLVTSLSIFNASLNGQLQYYITARIAGLRQCLDDARAERCTTTVWSVHGRVPQ